MSRFDPSVLVVGLLIITGCTQEEPSARLDLRQEIVDLGTLDCGESSFQIGYENGGTIPLRIGSVSSTCACTEAIATPIVKPGCSGTLKGKVHVASGPGSAMLSLRTNESNDQRQVRVRWFGRSQPTMLPSALDVSLKVGEKITRELEVSYQAGDPPVALEFLGVIGLPERVKIELIANEPTALRAIPGLSASKKNFPLTLRWSCETPPRFTRSNDARIIGVYRTDSIPAKRAFDRLAAQSRSPG